MQRTRATALRGGLLAGMVMAVTGAFMQPAAAGDVRTIEITAEEFRFEPARIEVDKGQTVRLKLVNDGRLSHNLHVRGNGVKAHTKTVQKGASDVVELTPSEAGTIELFCKVPGHKQAGMTGKLVVQ